MQLRADLKLVCGGLLWHMTKISACFMQEREIFEMSTAKKFEEANAYKDEGTVR